MGKGGASTDDDRRESSRERIYDVLSHDDCRRVLAALVDGGGELTRSELHTVLERTETERSSDRTPHERQLLLLHHYLPKLEEAGLVSTDGDRVRSTVDDAGLPPDIYSFITHDRTAVAHGLRVLSVDPRQRVVEHLVASDALSLTELADQLVSMGVGDESGGAAPTADALAVALHHVHLPVLHKAGFVRYDPAQKTVASAVEDAGEVVAMATARRQ